MIVPPEVLPGIWQLRLPLTGNSMREVNSYLLADEDGYALVDCGWDSDDSLEALEQQLAALDVRPDALRTLVVTHMHADHYGMTARLKQLTGARLLLHRLERLFIETRVANVETLNAELGEWLRANGTPEGELQRYIDSSLPMLQKVQVSHPDQALQGGELLRVGGRTFEVLWTPGHTLGHICLYSADGQVLLAGDHILDKISPNLGSHLQPMGAPLADYLTSLELVARLDVELVLPAHGKTFTTLAARARELLEHHRARLTLMVELLSRSEMTAYQVARKIRWSSRGSAWDELPDFHQRAAIGETIVHLEYLAGRGTIARRYTRGYVLYGPPTGSEWVAIPELESASS